MRHTTCLLALVLIGAVACVPSSSVPTEQEARAFLAQIVAAAKAGDIAALCDVSNCMPDDRKPFQAPADAPTIVGTRVIQPTKLPGGGEDLGGQVLELCGIAPNSVPYRFEMLVFRAEGRLHTPTYRYWQNLTVSGGSSPTTAPGSSGPPVCPTA